MLPVRCELTIDCQSLTVIFSRRLARKYLNEDEIPYTLTSFPRLGVPGVFTDPYFDPADAKSSHSLFLPEEITNPHARFPSVVSHTRRHVLALSPLILQYTNGKYSAAARFEGRHKPAVVYRLAHSPTVRGPINSMAAEHILGGSWYV